VIVVRNRPTGPDARHDCRNGVPGHSRCRCAGQGHKVKELESHPNVLVRRIEGEYNSSDGRGMFHCFLPAYEEGVEYMMSRDTDSHLAERERLSVEDWLHSGADFRVMRAHPYHAVPTLGVCGESRTEH
jgi:hypothetical protein